MASTPKPSSSREAAKGDVKVKDLDAWLSPTMEGLVELKAKLFVFWRKRGFPIDLLGPKSSVSCPREELMSYGEKKETGGETGKEKKVSQGKKKKKKEGHGHPRTHRHLNLRAYPSQGQSQEVWEFGVAPSAMKKCPRHPHLPPSQWFSWWRSSCEWKLEKIPE